MGQIVIFALMVMGTLLASNPANAQLTLDGVLQDQQIQIDPNKGIKIVPDPNLCLHPKVKKNGVCVCPSNMQPFGTGCKLKLVLCAAPFVHDGQGGCKCPNGTFKNGNKCTPLIIGCVAPQFPDGQGGCKCPAGLKKQGGSCVPIVNPAVCQAPFVPNNAGTKCVCPFGTVKLGGTCVNLPKTCPSPMTNQNGVCVCPSGYDKVGNKCLPQINNPQCNWPFVYKSSTNSCVCARGYRLNNSGNKCIKKAAAPTVSKAVVAEIQYCLARLGYEPGPADGAPGRRTREAWSNFRRDEGLQARPNNLADAVTQDRLFQACARVENAPEPEEEPETPATDGTNSGTNFDPETGYPPIQCASKAVSILLQGLVGQDEEIGICGEVCVPIPDGMTPEQVEATSESVNWCRNCTKIGEDGLLCSAKPEETEEN